MQGRPRDYPTTMVSRRAALLGVLGSGVFLADLPSAWALWGSDTTVVAPQPYFAHVRRVLEALRLVGQPLAPMDVERLQRLSERSNAAAVDEAEAILSKYTLACVRLDKDGSGHCLIGGAHRELVEQGWRS